MQRRFFVLVIVGLLVVLAGCVGGSGTSNTGGEPDNSATGDVTLVENRTAALLDAGGYTSTWEMKYTNEDEGTGSTTYTHAVDYENQRSSFEMQVTDQDEVTNAFTNFYVDGVSYVRYGEGDEATYSASESLFTPENTMFPVESTITSASDLTEFSAVGTETYDGITVTRYERTDQPDWIAPQATGTEFTWTEFTYVVLVDTDGLVRYENWSGEGVDEAGTETTMTFSYSLTGVGSTVIEDPNWLTIADAQTNE